MNNIKKMMQAGKTVLGPFMKIADPALVEIFGMAGFDFVILDLEHGPNSIETTQNLIRAAKLQNISPIIRVYENSPGLVQRVLDIGADGVQVPQISTLQEAKKLIRSARFSPEGERGLCRFVRAADYSLRSKDNYFNNANEENLIIGQIEGLDGVENLDQILTTGLDVIFIGPYDLSNSLGLPGQVDHPEVIKKVKEICQKANNRGVLIGTFVDDIETAHFYQNLGVKYISYSVDVGIIAEASKKIISSF